MCIRFWLRINTQMRYFLGLILYFRFTFWYEIKARIAVSKNLILLENFFDFRRSKLWFTPTGHWFEHFSTKLKIITFVFEVIVPYVRDKLDSIWTEVKDKDSSQLSKVKSLLKRFYKYFDAIIGVVNFLFQLTYLLLPKQNFYKCYFWMFSLIVRRKNAFERKQDSPNGALGFWGLFWQYNIFLLFLAVKFLQWYFSQDSKQA